VPPFCGRNSALRNHTADSNQPAHLKVPQPSHSGTGEDVSEGPA
jgi:hypothetical protein